MALIIHHEPCLFNSNSYNNVVSTKTKQIKWPIFSEDEINATHRVLASGKVNYWTGNEGKQFEKEFSHYFGANHSIAVSNGTVALELALEAIGIQPGDEVIIPSCTFIATASAVVMRGATPVIADIEPYKLTICPKSVRSKLTSKTKVIICVHLGGIPCNLDELSLIASENNCYLIEDCAQAHGASYNGKKVGSVGDISAFSFCQDKIMTTGGEGGMVSTNSELLWKRAWEFKDHGKSYDSVYNREHPPGFRWHHESFGTNFRMTEMQSAIGRVQLKLLDSWLTTRRFNAEKIWASAKKFSCFSLPIIPENCISAYYKCYIFVNEDQLQDGWSRDRIMGEINSLGTPCFSGSCTEIYKEKCFKPFKLVYQKALPNALDMGKRSLMFLIDPTIDREKIMATVHAIESVGSLASK